MFAELVDVVFFQVDAVEEDNAIIWVIEPSQKLTNCRLATSTLSNESNRASTTDCKVEVVKNLPRWFALLVFVCKTHIFEFDTSLEDGSINCLASTGNVNGWSPIDNFKSIERHKCKGKKCKLGQ